MTHDYKRLGTIDLFAAMTVAAGEVLTDLRGSPSGAGELNHGNELWMVDVRAAGVDRSTGLRSRRLTPELGGPRLARGDDQEVVDSVGDQQAGVLSVGAASVSVRRDRRNGFPHSHFRAQT
jgi:hypothetical protein